MLIMIMIMMGKSGSDVEAIFLSMLTYSNYLLTEYNICRDSDA